MAVVESGSRQERISMGTILPLPIYSTLAGHTQSQATLRREYARAAVTTTVISCQHLHDHILDVLSGDAALKLLLGFKTCRVADVQYRYLSISHDATDYGATDVMQCRDL